MGRMMENGGGRGGRRARSWERMESELWEMGRKIGNGKGRGGERWEMGEEGEEERELVERWRYEQRETEDMWRESG